ncbi:MAG: large subunit ribosomal protein L9 [Verrucomicrobiales bacterium]|jgi:large subunit ribosomal protein L9
MMQVILKSDVSGLGVRGDVVNVADGYFRNYLLPKNLGYKATKGAEAEAQAMRKSSAAKNEASRAEADKIAASLVPQIIAISAKTDDAGTLFGSVGATDIAAAVEEQTGHVIDRKAFQLESALKTLGQHMVMTSIHTQVQFPVTVEITSDEE